MIGSRMATRESTIKMLDFSLISGVMVGIESVYDEDEDEEFIIIDLFCIRVLISWK